MMSYGDRQWREWMLDEGQAEPIVRRGARGRLTGSRSRSGEPSTVRARNDAFADQLYDKSDFEVIDAVTTIAAERGLPPAQIALVWLLHKPGVAAPIVGATKVEHLDDAVAALDVTLTDTELHRLEERYRPHGVRDSGSTRRVGTCTSIHVTSEGAGLRHGVG